MSCLGLLDRWLDVGFVRNEKEWVDSTVLFLVALESEDESKGKGKGWLGCFDKGSELSDKKKHKQA